MLAPFVGGKPRYKYIMELPTATWLTSSRTKPEARQEDMKLALDRCAVVSRTGDTETKRRKADSTN